MAQIQALISHAAQAHASGRLDESETFLLKVLTEDGQNVQALLLLGIIYVKKDRLDEAISLLERVRRADLSSFQARLWLSIALRRHGDAEGTLASAKEAVALNAKDPQGWNQLGQAQLDIQDFRAAERSFAAAIALAPMVAQLHLGVGLAHQGLRNRTGAISSLRRAAQLAPNYLPLQTSIRQALMVEQDTGGAVESARNVVRIQPDSAEANLWLARALIEDNKATQAEKYVLRGVELEPESGLAQTLLGSIAQIKGDIATAERHFVNSIEVAPAQGSAYLAFVSNRRMSEEDRPLIDRMEELLDDAALSAHHVSQLHSGLGKAYEDLGEFERAMRHFDESNRIAHELKMGTGRFDGNPMRQRYDSLVDRFTPGLFAENAKHGSTSELPIFVLGMMRSGTTLVEQILSSHSRVGAAGEQRFWFDHGNEVYGPGHVSLDRAALTRLAAEYEALLRGFSAGADRVVDKLPVNYESVGSIHATFPKAKILHIRRHPVDTCISIYTTPNRNRIDWAYDKGDIAFAYEQYLRLMEHWRKVLPAGVMMDVVYEELVSDREATTRAMIEFCGLEWEESCLRPEKNERSVVTPSVWQVRQPVYRTSMNRWQRYEPWLGELRRLMPEVGE